jgi:hypothetical protein
MRRYTSLSIAAVGAVGLFFGFAGEAAASRCAYGAYTVAKGDTCTRLYLKLYCSKATLFTKYNGFTCRSPALWIGRLLCRPKKVGGICQ